MFGARRETANESDLTDRQNTTNKLQHHESHKVLDDPHEVELKA